MKKITLSLLIVLLGTLVMAQDEDLAGDEKNEFKTVFQRKGEKIFVTGFGGPVMAFTSIGKDFAHMMGGGGGILVNNFFFGGYGVGLTTPIDYLNDNDGTQGTYSLEFGHGGLWTGFIVARKRPVHLSVSSQFGWGNVSQRVKTQPDLSPATQEPVFVVTPIVEIELNFSQFIKVGLGASTSLVRGAGIVYTPYRSEDFLQPSVYLTFKFGYFN